MIKVLIIDFDDTLWSIPGHQAWKDYTEFSVVALSNLLAKRGVADPLAYIGEYGLSKTSEHFSTNNYSMLEYSDIILGDVRPWVRYIDKNFYHFDITLATVASPAILKKLAEKYTLYCVSNSPKRYLRYNAKRMNVDLSMFKKVISNPVDFRDATKRTAYANILKKEKIQPHQALAIGDSFRRDIVPAIELGMQSLLIKDSSDFNEEMIEYIKGL